MASWQIVLRSFLFFLNLAMLLAALALIAVGFWMRYDNSFDTDLKSVIWKKDDPKQLADAKFNARVWPDPSKCRKIRCLVRNHHDHCGLGARSYDTCSNRAENWWKGLIVVFWSIIGLSIGAAVTGIIGMVSALLPKRKRFMMTYLILIIILIALEIGSGIAVLVRRNSLHETTNILIDAMYSTNSIGDIKIIQDTYSCCGTSNNVFNTMYCGIQNVPYCDVAFFDSIDNTMMISGIVFLVVLVLQIIATVSPAPLLIQKSKKYIGATYEAEEEQVERF